MRVVTKTAVAQAIETYSQWKEPLNLWLTTFDRPPLRFESFDQIRDVWALPQDGTSIAFLTQS